MKTGISRLLPGDSGQVQGLIVPNDATNQQMAGPAPPRSSSRSNQQETRNE